MSFDNDAYYREKLTGYKLLEDVIRNKVFEECEFSDCMFIGSRFDKCRFLNCKFIKCDLSNIVPMNCEFREVRFSGSKVIGVDWTRASKIKELSFKECLINYSNFRLLKLPKTTMTKCEAKEVDFIEADFSHGNFRHTDFEKSVFFKTDLSEADFTGATNYSIDVKANTLKKTRFALPEALSLLNNLDIIVE